MSQKAPYSHFWHARHACRHSVFWSNPEWAIRTSVAPCPWCGGETGQKVPPDVSILRIREADVVAFRETMPDGTPPWPREFPETVTLHHAADESCCSA